MAAMNDDDERVVTAAEVRNTAHNREAPRTRTESTQTQQPPLSAAPRPPHSLPTALHSFTHTATCVLACCDAALSSSAQVESSTLDSLDYGSVDPKETENLEIVEYPALSAEQINEGAEQYVRVPVPPHRSDTTHHAQRVRTAHAGVARRDSASTCASCVAAAACLRCFSYTPLKTHWMEIYTPIVEHMKIQIRMNPKKRCVELKVRSPAQPLRAIARGSAVCAGVNSCMRA